MMFSLFHYTVIAVLCYSGLVNCGDYQSFGGKSYYLEKKDQINWNSANNFCRGLWNGTGQLAVVTSAEESDFIYNSFGKAKSSSIWIGGNDIKNEGIWVWANNCPFNSVVQKLWQIREPNNYKGDENCLHIWGQFDGRWNDINCDNRYNYACEKVTSPPCTYHGPNIAKGKKVLQSSTSSNGDARRATDGIVSSNYLDNGCTHTIDESQNWLVIDLGEVHTVNSVKLINRQDCCADRLQNFYVAVSYEEKPTFSSNDSQPNNAEICSYQKDPVGADIVIDCKGITGRYVVITKYKNDALTLCEVEVFAVVNQNIKFFNNQVYYVEKKNPLSWPEANEFCKSLWNGNGRLVNVESVEENNFLLEQFKNELYNVWLGGNDIRHEGFFAWSNGCPVDNNNVKNSLWIPKQPDNCCAGEHCMHLNAGNKEKWNDLDCNVKMSFVCQRETAAQQCNYLGPNIALNKAAWQSSDTTMWGGVASRAIDGNTNQDYYAGKSCSHTENNGRNFLIVDLQNFYNVTHIELFNRLDCCTERLADFAVSIGHVADKDRANLKFKGLVPIGFQLCHYQKEAVGSSIFITCNSGKIGQQIAIVKPSNILTLCEVKAYGNKVQSPPMICYDNTTKYNVGENWRDESKCQDYQCTINGLEIVNTDCNQGGKCFKVGQNFSDDTNCLKMRCEAPENQSMQVTERGCRSDNQCQSHQQSFLETSTCKNFLCNNGVAELQETGCRLDGACVKNNETLFDQSVCRYQKCENGKISITKQQCLFRNNCVDQGFEFYNNQTCMLFVCSPNGKMTRSAIDCVVDNGCLKSTTEAEKKVIEQDGKDESCKKSGLRYDVCRCTNGNFYAVEKYVNNADNEYLS